MADWVLAVSTLIGAGVYLRAMLDIPPLMVGDVVGPRFFPALIGIGLLVSAALLFYETWQKRLAAVGAPNHPPATNSQKPERILVCMAVWTLIYYAAFEPVGYIVSTLVYIFCLLCYFNRVKWWHNAIYTLGFTGSAYLIFAVFLHVVLPSGILPI